MPPLRSIMAEAFAECESLNVFIKSYFYCLHSQDIQSISMHITQSYNKFA